MTDDKDTPTPWPRALYSWVLSHWGLLAALAGAVGGLLVGRAPGRSVKRRVEIEQHATEVARQVQALAAEQGAAAAHAAVQQTYGQEMAALQQQQQQQAQALLSSPDALAAFVVRASGSDKDLP